MASHRPSRISRLFLVLSASAVLVFPCYVGQAQQNVDTLVDVFPLTVGNQWTYRYFMDNEVDPGGIPYEAVKDSGEVTYTVIGKVTAADSIRWQMEERRHLLHHQVYFSPSHDTAYVISDTSIFEMIERLNDQHQLYRLADPWTIHLDVYPFTPGFSDTTQICRFKRLGSGDSTTFYSWTGPPPGQSFQSNFTFRKNVGLVRRSYNSGSIDVWTTTEHYLTASTITSAPRDPKAAPSELRLYQNYPNPFNPATTIGYSLPRRSRVSLAVFNALGQQVAVLVDAVQDAGYHDVRSDASGLASGVYFYRLQAGASASVKRMILVR